MLKMLSIDKCLEEIDLKVLKLGILFYSNHGVEEYITIIGVYTDLNLAYDLL